MRARNIEGTMRARLHTWLYGGPNAKWGFRWDVLQAVLACLSCGIYIANTYAEVGACSLMPPTAELMVEIVTGAFFLVDYGLALFLATAPEAVRAAAGAWVEGQRQRLLAAAALLVVGAGVGVDLLLGGGGTTSIRSYCGIPGCKPYFHEHVGKKPPPHMVE